MAFDDSLVPCVSVGTVVIRVAVEADILRVAVEADILRIRSEDQGGVCPSNDRDSLDCNDGL